MRKLSIIKIFQLGLNYVLVALLTNNMLFQAIYFTLIDHHASMIIIKAAMKKCLNTNDTKIFEEKVYITII